MTALKIAALACLFVSTAAAAQTAAPVPATPAPVKEKMVCRSAVATGSIMAKRECHTKAEWAAIRAKDGENAANSLDQLHRRDGGLTPGG